MASVSNFNLKVTLDRGYFYVVVSTQFGPYGAPNYYMNVAADPILRRYGTLSASDPKLMDVDLIRMLRSGRPHP